MDPNPITSILKKGEKSEYRRARVRTHTHTHTHTHRGRPCEEGHRDQDAAITSQGMPRVASNHQRIRERLVVNFSL